MNNLNPLFKEIVKTQLNIEELKEEIKLGDAALLELAMQALKAIRDGQRFKDQAGDKVILATWQDFAGSTIKQIENLKK